MKNSPTEKFLNFPPVEYKKSKGSKQATLIADHTPYLITGWYKPSIFDKQSIAFDVLSSLLTSGLHSRLVKRLVVQEKLAKSVRSYSGIPGNKLENMFALFLRLYSEKQYGKVLELIYEELEIFAKEGPTAEELEKN